MSGTETKKQRKTVVRGLRASDTFWERCDKAAESENMTRNEFILAVVNEYLEKEYGKAVKKVEVDFRS